MTAYTVWCQTNRSTEFCGRQLECDQKDLPNRLLDIARPYIKDVPGQDTVKADVSAGKKWTTYLIQLQKDTVSVYLLKAKFVRSKKQEPTEHPSNTEPPLAKDGAA